MRALHVSVGLLVLGFGVSAMAAEPETQAERGRYLVQIAGCNDCHTSRYSEKNGDVAESDWLTGDAVGWRGPWGTTYPVNLRLLFQAFTEDQWVKFARSKQSRPPMPWYVLSDMHESDLRAIYAFVRGLGPAGNPAPAYVPPGSEPNTAYISFVPIMPATPAAETESSSKPAPMGEEKDAWWQLKPAKPKTRP